MNKVWKTKDGKKIEIKDMKDSHLLNAINLFTRMAEAKKSETLSFYLNCTPPTAEYASYAFEQELDAAIDAEAEDYLPEIYFDLVKEKERRQLSSDR